MKTITYTQLKDAGTAGEPLKLFVTLFPDGVRFKSEAHVINFAKEVSHAFDLEWAVSNLLTEAAQASYEESLVAPYAAYRKVQKEVMSEYEELEANICAIFLGSEGFTIFEDMKNIVKTWFTGVEPETPALTTFKKDMKTLSDRYEKPWEAIHDDYEVVKITAFAKAYWSMS